MSEKNTPLVYVVEILTEAQQDIKRVFEARPQGGHIELIVDNGLTALINRIAALGGGTVVASTSLKDMFPPITDFLGEKIEPRKDLAEEDLQPTLDEETLYKNKVAHLENSIAGMSNESVLYSYMGPDELDIIRGAALRAGVLDYETRPIDGSFLDDLRQAVARNKQHEKDVANADEAIASVQNKKPVELTPEQKLQLEADLAPAAPGTPGAPAAESTVAAGTVHTNAAGPQSKPAVTRNPQRNA